MEIGKNCIYFVKRQDRVFLMENPSVDITSEFPVLWHNPDSHRNGIASPEYSSS